MIKPLSRAVLVTIVTLFSTHAVAQTETAWPERPVQLVLPYTPGGATDRLARIMAEHLYEPFQQSFVVDNRAGATGAIGSGYVARAKPDGYTNLFGFAGSMVLAPLLRSNLPYDSLNDFDTVARLVTYDFVLVAGSDSPVNTLDELISHGRNGDGQIEYGTHGIGSPSHLAMENVSQTSGVEMLHVPYKGEQAMVADLLGDHIQFGWLTVNIAEPFLKDGTLKSIVIGSSQRSSKLPDTQTLKESGFEEAGFEAWAGLLAPRGTPQPIIAKFSAELANLLGQQGLQDELTTANFIPAYLGPDEFRTLIEADLRRYGRLVDAAGIERQ